MAQDRYDDLGILASTPGGAGFYSLLSKFQWDEEMIKYVRGERSNPHGRIWTGAKRILGVINMDGICYRVVEMLLEEGKIKVYDCNLLFLDEANFFTQMQPLLELFPNLLRQSELMHYFAAEVLMKKPWDFEDILPVLTDSLSVAIDVSSVESYISSVAIDVLSVTSNISSVASDVLSFSSDGSFVASNGSSVALDDVVNCMQIENLELKKLVDLDLINQSKSQPDLAILAINTFVKDSQDPNPLISDLAVRTRVAFVLIRSPSIYVIPFNIALRMMILMFVAKYVVLAKKPVISDDSKKLNPTLLDKLLPNIYTLSSVYHKPSEAFIIRVMTTQKIEDKEYTDTGEQGYYDSPAPIEENGVSPPASTSNVQHPAARQPSAPTFPALFLLDLGIDNSNNAIVSVDQDTTSVGPSLPIVLPASSGQGFQISA
ncbi:putative glycosyltransferase-like [Capsicum annuum]|nr:putative glycosyltransferase-like [Capsicum annuum]